MPEFRAGDLTVTRNRNKLEAMGIRKQYARSACSWLTCLLLGTLGQSIAASPASEVNPLEANGADAIDANKVLRTLAMKRGAEVFQQACAECHGKAMKGSIAHHAPNLKDDYWLYGGHDIETFRMVASDVESLVLHGIRTDDPKTLHLADMPAKGFGGTLDPGEIDDLTAYVWAMRVPGRDAAAIARGRELYATEGGCYDCHGHDARGDSAIGAPSLFRPDVWLWGHDQAALRSTVTLGHMGNSCPAFEGRLPIADIRAVAVYVLNRAASRHF